MRGDEPMGDMPSSDSVWVCPTCVGMNRLSGEEIPTQTGMPHMRGDEPRDLQKRLTKLWYAPHAWG